MQKCVIPELAAFDIDPVRGFMPTTVLRRLPQQFEPWEVILDDLSRLLLAAQLRNRVRKVRFRYAFLKHIKLGDLVTAYQCNQPENES